MKAKLKKESDGDYILILNDPKEYQYPLPLLSKQNCDEIFGVVDVDKLADEYCTYEQIGRASCRERVSSPV